MITDVKTDFIHTALAITTGTITSDVIDLLGTGVGTMPNSIIGNAALFGADVGVGGLRPQIEVLITEAFVGGTSVQVKFQAAPDVATTHVEGTYVTLVETPAIVTASLTLGNILARFDYPPVFPLTLRPRYLRLAFTCVGTFSLGKVLAPTTMVRDDTSNRQTPANYTVA